MGELKVMLEVSNKRHVISTAGLFHSQIVMAYNMAIKLLREQRTKGYAHRNKTCGLWF